MFWSSAAPSSPKEVVVIGGSFAGIAAVNSLLSTFTSQQVHITLIEFQQARYNNVATPRAAVDTAFVEKLYMPYDRLFRNASIRDRYPDKSVTIVSNGPGLSLGKASPAFAARLAAKLKQMRINVIYNETAVLDQPLAHKIGPHTLTTKSGLQIESDLTILAIGMGSPNSQLLESYKGGSLLNDRKEIKVLPTLQVADEDLPNVFSFGDVAATGAPKMAVPVTAQAAVAAKNIKSLMRGHKPTAEYKAPDFQVMIITLGTRHAVSELSTFVPGFVGDHLGGLVKGFDLFTNKIRFDQNLGFTL
ncbi:hypothetical protein BC831DRAFT_123115 [Entophlyctis helioformis]|nr:hypothetical protein BC831DRAFT_123115 [Entophlyctis helioformis]